ncbi:hypothetical protein C7H79_16285 [Nitrosomonas supralitoralis]|uniref:Uncharacterized protein n=1 Tax=Nitrosomonas supralitoralis TaxID=2116706 RepID=A0A2P7NR38_9PROT|nr:hypothetical protein C7H79_16285 [Nitrosomonas supralitoralis]
MELSLNHQHRQGSSDCKARLIIDECDRNSIKLSDNELSFIDLMHNRLVDGMPLMAEHKLVLVTIWRKIRGN